MKIPKIIHYCWFGRGEYPELVRFCMDSWQKNLPDYKLQIWTEDNFDVNSLRFTREAYQRRKFAYVSDYARLQALYQYGGIYLDTDVEVLRSFDELLIEESFMGFEDNEWLSTAVIGSVASAPWLDHIMGYYAKKPFVRHLTRKLNMKPNPQIITALLRGNFGFRGGGEPQQLACGMKIMAQEAFSPKSYDEKLSRDVTENTFAVHHFGNLGRC